MRKITLLVAAAMLSSAIVLIGVAQGAAHAEVTQVEGSAYGVYFNYSVEDYDGDPQTGGPYIRGPEPTVTLPPGGSAVPITATHGWFYSHIFSADQIDVSTRGKTGSTGLVSSSTNIQNVNYDAISEFTADKVSSTCIATEADTSSGSTTITNGELIVDVGNPDVQGDETVIQVPTNPPPNTRYWVLNAWGDDIRYVFNEQIVDPADGSITVNAVHEYFWGPNTFGELIVGQSVCGVRATTTPTAITPPTVTSVVPQEGATGIAPGANISAIFSEAMKSDSINTNTVKLLKVEEGPDTLVDATVNYGALAKKATLNPIADLVRGARYKAVVTTGAKDLAGNRLDQDPTLSGNQPKAWFFRVSN